MTIIRSAASGPRARVAAPRAKPSSTDVAEGSGQRNETKQKNGAQEKSERERESRERDRTRDKTTEREGKSEGERATRAKSNEECYRSRTTIRGDGHVRSFVSSGYREIEFQRIDDWKRSPISTSFLASARNGEID